MGSGAMGRLFARFFLEWGWEVDLTDVERKKAERAKKELGIRKTIPAEAADMVLVATPISETPKVLEEMSRKMKKGALLVEISSVKEQIVSTMQRLKHKGLELVALHPLFGPGVITLRGERFAVVPVKTGEVFQKLCEKLRAEGAELIRTSAKEHDSKLARNQALSHLLLLSYLSLCDRGKLHTRLSRTLLDLAKAMLAGNPSLYYEIQTLNRHTSRVREELRRFNDRLDRILSEKKKGEFEKLFRSLVRRYGKEVEQAYRRLYTS